ncbi:MAG: SpoIIE family protein phosphatase [Clostridia bacterium]|nr:SpoIIE family protein phosphatase [Clostridia bacterium]
MNTAEVKRTKNEIYIGNFIKHIIAHLTVAVSGFFSSCAAFDGLAPLGVSLCASIFPEYIPSAVIGAISGSFYVYGSTVLTLRYVAAAVIASIVSFVFKRSLKQKFHIWFSVLSSFVSLFATGLVLSLSVTISASEFILYFAEGIAGALFAWFFSIFMSIKYGKKNIARFSVSEITAVLIVFGVMLISLGYFSFLYVKPAVISGVYVVLCAAVYGGDRFGALSGIAAGTILGLSEKSGFLTGGISLGGLLCGFFGRNNKLFSSIILVICVSLTAFATDDWTQTVAVFYNVLSAAAFFVLTPKKITERYKKFFSGFPDGNSLAGQREILRSRLRTAADGMNDVTSSVKAVAGIYRRRTMPREELIYDNVIKNVCSGCDMYNQCINKYYDETLSWFVRIAESLKKGSEPGKRDLPENFLSSCLSTETIIRQLSFDVERYRTALRECAKTGETVNIVSDQFGSVSQLLESFSRTMESDEEYDIAKSGILYDVLTREMNLSLISCGVFRNEDRRFYCEISLPVQKKDDYKRIVKCASEALELSFENAVVRELSDKTVVVNFCEKTKYSVEYGSNQISSGGCKWCGDTYDSFYDGKGFFFMILSDGMGTGQKAAADSVLCCSLASLLLRSGYPVESILKMINSAMLVRSGEESLATLDIAVMNLYTGETEFYKAGAASSVVMKNFRMLKAEKPSLPVGILGDVSFERISLGLGDSDVVILMSDGVCEKAISVWKEILRDAVSYDGKELARKLAKTAHMNNDDDADDDITVTVAVMKAKQ